MLTSFSSSLPLPLGIPSSDPTTPNLGLRFNSNSGSVPFCSTMPLLPSSSVPPIPLQLPPQLPNLLLLQTLILLLHGDDVYFTLENSLQDGVQHREGGASSKNQSKSGSATVSRYVNSELDSMSQE